MLWKSKWDGKYYSSHILFIYLYIYVSSHKAEGKSDDCTAENSKRIKCQRIPGKKRTPSELTPKQSGFYAESSYRMQWGTLFGTQFLQRRHHPQKVSFAEMSVAVSLDDQAPPLSRAGPRPQL